jgi:hypothetical protein
MQVFIITSNLTAWIFDPQEKGFQTENAFQDAARHQSWQLPNGLK